VISRTCRFFEFLALAMVIGCAQLLASSAEVHAAPPSSASRAAGTSAFIGRIVGTIDVRGQKRIEKDAVLNKLVTKAGQALTREGLKQDVQGIQRRLGAGGSGSAEHGEPRLRG
jgi:outer membrane protein assembly factor BamA